MHRMVFNIVVALEIYEQNIDNEFYLVALHSWASIASATTMQTIKNINGS